jgi:hypothetical protein
MPLEYGIDSAGNGINAVFQNRYINTTPVLTFENVMGYGLLHSYTPMLHCNNPQNDS